MRATSTVEHAAASDDADTAGELAGLLDASRSFPSAELVGAAAGLFAGGPRSGWVQGVARVGARHRWQPQLPAFYVHQLHREFFLRVSGGTVALRCEDTNRTEATAAARRDTLLSRLRWESVEGSFEPLAGLLAPGEVLPPAGYYLRPADDQDPPAPAGKIGPWSRKSRAAMTRALAELEYAPMFAQAGTPAMVTLTYPGDWQAVAPDGATVKRHLQALLKRWSRAWHGGATVPVLWKLEFQSRGAPHFHLFAVPPHGVSAGRKLAGLPFIAWLSQSWADVVGASDVPDAGGGSERARHEAAGTGVDYREGVRARDPKRLAVYFSKSGGAGGGKEYQHVVPELWLERPDAGPGRYWGYRGLERVVAEVAVGVGDYVLLRRTLRRLSQSQRVTRDVGVPRGRVELVDVADGELVRVPVGELGTMVRTGLYGTAGPRRTRRVTRRRRRLAAGGLAGGFLCVNDGPALASQLAGLVERVEPTGGGLRAWLCADDNSRPDVPAVAGPGAVIGC